MDLFQAVFASGEEGCQTAAEALFLHVSCPDVGTITAMMMSDAGTCCFKCFRYTDS